MKKIILILTATVFLFCSCEKGPVEPKKERIEKDVVIRFNNGSGSFTCGEYCGTTIEIINVEKGLKPKFELPDSILNKWEWWNREYVASIKFLDETCHCKNGDIDFNPNNPDTTYPVYDLRMIEIIEIREK